MQTSEVTPAQLRAKVSQAKYALDELRQLDNRILFEMGNPPEFDVARGMILDSMHKLVGLIQEAEQRLLGLENGG